MSAFDFPQVFSSVRGRITEVRESEQHVVIEDASGVIHTVHLPPRSLGLSTWLSTREILIGREIGVVTRSGGSGRTWIVLDPDVVVDITEAAQLVTTSGVAEDQVLVKRMRRSGAMSLALTGTLVNTAFDILTRQPTLSDEVIMADAERTRPLSLAAAARENSLGKINDVLTRAMSALRAQYTTFSNGMIALEPHYISPTFGLQGRADICVRNGDTTRVIEMKAGSAASGVSVRPDHAAQVAGYTALVQATEPGRTVSAEVWYVQAEHVPIRPVNDVDQWLSLLIAARNVIIANDLALTKRQIGPVRRIMQSGSVNGGSSYDEHARADLAAALTYLDATEALVVRAWLGFTSADHEMVRIGGGSSRSTADLWRQDITEKRRASTVITDLELDETGSNMDRMHLVLRRQEPLTDCALRIGDPVILHPESNGEARPCDGPLFKAVLRTIGPLELEVSLRNKYAEVEDLIGRRWILEQDVLDTSVRSFYAAIRTFIDTPESKRSVLLGRRDPLHSPIKEIDAIGLTSEQKSIIERALASDELFLIQGPPGTGKTSAVLRSIVADLVNRPNERVLAVAYTNRAANEISAVLAHHGIAHLRHGSSEGALGERSIPVLGQRLSPQELSDAIAESRCIVSTVQSLYSSAEIWEFGAFTTAVVDEASQILETPLIGITSRVGRAILIGDQCQLPAVVTQRQDALVVRGLAFEEICMTSLGMSAFERLIRCAAKRGDERSTAMLTKQGRMHQDLMDFVSRTFYGGKLNTLAGWQCSKEPLPWSEILPSRTGFLSVESSDDQAQAEARVLVNLATAIHSHAVRSGHETSIGIITPFRVQNNAILAMLPTELTGVVSVDTVERFQGSERDVILYGTCVREPAELESIVSPTEVNGVVIDRKLNVAMTRARHQFILIGSPSVLQFSPAYAQAIRQLPRIYVQRNT
ncbi:MAG: ATP-dependent helicase [Candidatus Kapabacteria bacterium]|nr:ATP-dependent helicase [Candidatus Kapabacteria bacterium]